MRRRVDNSSVTRHLSRVLAALLTGLGGLVMTPLPAVAATFSGAGTVYAGMYSTEWESETDLSNMAAWAGKRATFVGTFHDPGEWVGAAAHLLEEAWDAQATPFANLSVNATAASIAAGNHDAAIRQWAQRVEAWVDDGGGRSLIIAPLQEMNGHWTPYGCDHVNFKTAYTRIRNLVIGEGLDETKVRWAWAPNGWTDPDCGSLIDFYPGSNVVDIIAFSAYRWASESVSDVAGGVTADLRTFAPTSLTCWPRPRLASPTRTSGFATSSPGLPRIPT